MLRKRNNLVVLLMLALLQCVVPLLHAHAGGLHISTGVHLHLAPVVAAGHDRVSELTSDFCDSAVVGVANELKRDLLADALGVPALLPAPYTVPQLQAGDVPVACDVPAPIPASLRRPPSHAPPQYA